MSVQSRIGIVLASVWGCQLLFASAAQPAGEQWIGRVLHSHATILRGVAVPKVETIFSGDVLTTADNGSAVVETKSGVKVEITRNTSVRFLDDGGEVQVDLLAGAVVAENAGKPALVVATSNYHFTPSQEGNCRFAVALSKERDTVAGAMQGNLLIMTSDSQASYILPEGEYAAIPISSIGVPAQERTAGEAASAGPAGIVKAVIPEDVIKRPGQAAEIPLKLEDAVNVDDIVRTLKSGRVRIELPGGSLLNVGPRSTMRIVNQNAASQQTLVELALGTMRAELVKLTKADASFEVGTMTAEIGVAGNKVLVQALPNLTEVYCIAGVCSVQNIDPAIPGQVTLHDGESTTVPGGFSPTAPARTLLSQLQSQMKETDVGPTEEVAAEAPAPSVGAKPAWHFGRLSAANSLLLALGIDRGGTAVPMAAAAASADGGAASPSSSAP